MCGLVFRFLIAVTSLWDADQLNTICCYIHVENLINAVHKYFGITSGRVFDGDLLYTKILEVNLFPFAYRLFHRDFSLDVNTDSLDRPGFESG